MSKTARYTYSGPVSGVTLREQGQSREILLHPGKIYELPPEHPHVRRLIARRHLTPAPAAKARRKTPNKEEN